MKILDRYVAKTFMTGYLIAFSVMIGLRVVIDLFVNLDEFVENADQGTLRMLGYTAEYYGLHLTLYFRDFAGMITVVAAAFSLGKMTRTNELTAIMASGVSLKRVVVPILVIALLLTGLLIADQEWLIPKISHKLVRRPDALKGQETYDVWFITDNNHSLICASRFNASTATFDNPTIILRDPTENEGIYQVTGRITADQATYNPATGQWDLINGQYIGLNSTGGAEVRTHYMAEDLNPIGIPVRLKAENKAMLSFRELQKLATHNLRDMEQLSSQLHFRITDPIINLVMLMVSLPVLVCRDPRSMKSAVMTSFGLTGACMIVSFACKMLATEPILSGGPIPEFWAWLPVFVFVPIAFIQLDAMKT